jgi:restriction endonuclease Mrr
VFPFCLGWLGRLPNLGDCRWLFYFFITTLFRDEPYWGDAKFSKNKDYGDWFGNKILKEIYNHVLEGKLGTVPPILHFSKPKVGQVTFNGLCVVEDLRLNWFEDELGRIIKNYHAHLAILDTESVSVDWINARRDSSIIDSSSNVIPNVWKNYINGNTQRINVWKRQIHSKEDQLPQTDDDKKILGELFSYTPEEFEKIIVALFHSMRNVTHKVEGTQHVVDGGFDFYGGFVLPPPLHYEIRFKGEVKRMHGGVGAPQVSRLVARLGRGEYGIFVTTSYFTRRAQSEILEDSYPVKLIAGGDLIAIMKSQNFVSQNVLVRSKISNILHQ